jgi:hypothetical protein
MSKRTSGESNATNGFAGLQRADLGDDAPPAQVGHQTVQAAKLEIALEDGSDPLGLGLIDRDLSVPGVIAEWCHAADPETFALGGRNLVPDPLGGDLALELGKRKQHVEGQSPHRGGGVELLGDRHEGHPMTVEQFDQLGKVGQGAGQTIDLVDDNDIDLAGSDIS